MVRADFDNDGGEDVIVGGATVSLHRAEAGAFAFTGKTLLGGGLANAIDVFDATGDAKPDLVLVNYYGGITVLPAP